MKWVWLATIVFVTQSSAYSAGAAMCGAAPLFSLDIPDGASASREAMLSTQRSLKTYDNAVMAFAACLRDAGHSMGAVDAADHALRGLASRFNEQLQIFKQHNGGT